MPSDLSISWAHLDPGEKLDTHRHPVSSLIIADGEAQSRWQVISIGEYLP